MTEAPQIDRAGNRRFFYWITIVTGLVLLDVASAALFDWSLGLTDGRGEGRALFLLLASAAAIQMIGADSRPQAAYGLATRPGWERHFFLVLGLSLLATGLIFLIAGSSGALGHVRDPGAGRIIGGAITAVVALIFALLQEIVYRGYLNTTLARRFGWGVAIPLGALIFALTTDFSAARWSDPVEALWQVISMFLIGLLLGLARLYHGSLVVPIALVTGPAAVSIFVRRAGLDAMPADGPPWAAWFLPVDGEAWQAPAMWLMIALAIAVYCALLFFRKATPEADKAPPVAKRGVSGRVMDALFGVNPFSNLWMLAPLDLWLRQLWRVRFRVSPRYLPRLAVAIVVSAFSTILNLPERLIAPILLARRTPADPVIIVGIHRSGTSHLQRLLALDPQFVTPRTHQVFNPLGFLFAGRIMTFLLGPFLPWRRPMDSMEFSPQQPDEDEFAIALSSPYSPYWSFVFPRDAGLFDRFIYPEQMTPAECAAWQRVLTGFLRKIVSGRARRPLLKSPFHAARLRLIAERFPGARFIHIHRHPFTVYRSNIHLQDRALTLFELQRPRPGEGHADRLIDTHYLAIEESFYEAAAALPADRTVDLRYEDHVAAPFESIEQVYEELGLDFSKAYRNRLQSYLERHRDYRANVFPTLDPATRTRLIDKLGPLFERWGYPSE